MTGIPPIGITLLWLCLISVAMPATGKTGDLRQAVKQGKLAAVQTLVASGADLEAVDRKGRTVLMIAAQRGHAAVVAFLVEAGARVDVRTKKGDLAETLALRKGERAIAELIAYQSAITVDTDRAYQRFLTDYPGSDRTAQIERQRDDRRWAVALASKSATAYEAFIRDNPSSAHLGAARGYLEAHLWTQLVDNPDSTLMEYQGFLARFPRGTHSVSAKRHIGFLEQKAREGEIRAFAVQGDLAQLRAHIAEDPPGLDRYGPELLVYAIAGATETRKQHGESQWLSTPIDKQLAIAQFLLEEGVDPALIALNYRNGAYATVRVAALTSNPHNDRRAPAQTAVSLQAYARLEGHPEFSVLLDQYLDADDQKIQRARFNRLHANDLSHAAQALITFVVDNAASNFGMPLAISPDFPLKMQFDRKAVAAHAGSIEIADQRYVIVGTFKADVEGGVASSDPANRQMQDAMAQARKDNPGVAMPYLQMTAPKMRIKSGAFTFAGSVAITDRSIQCIKGGLITESSPSAARFIDGSLCYWDDVLVEARGQNWRVAQLP